MKNFLNTFCAPILGCALIFSACASEENVEETVPNVQFVISAPFNAPASRAANEGAYVTEDTPNELELIKSYAVAVTLQGSSKIVAFVTKDELDGVESDPVDLQLRPGNYTVYGFANIPTSDLAKLGIEKNGTIPSTLGDARTLMPGIATTTGAPFQGTTLVDASQLGSEAFPAIPMTSINGQNVTVTERVNQTFGIEVRRMMAKLQFDFRNPTGKNLNLHGISVSDMTLNQTTTSSGANPFLLMNPEEARAFVNPEDEFTPAEIALAKTFPADFRKAKLTYTYPTDKLLSAGFTGKVTDDPKTAPQHSKTFYVLESAAPTTGANANSFVLDFDITDGSSTLGDNMRYALTSPNALTLIHRNDWIIIPITIGEWVMDITALSFPPIGGYPDAKVTSDQENVFNIKFSAPGDIAFYPTIHKYYSASDFFYLNDPSRIVGTPTITVSDPSNIFSAAPTTLGSAGEYTATLSGNSGTATVTITTQFYPNYPSSTPVKEFKSIIYVEKI